jgi:hypothetical protein
METLRLRFQTKSQVPTADVRSTLKLHAKKLDLLMRSTKAFWQIPQNLQA